MKLKNLAAIPSLSNEPDPSKWAFNHTVLLVLSTTMLLTAQINQAEARQNVDNLKAESSSNERFFTKSSEREADTEKHTTAGLLHRLCAIATRDTRIQCPSVLSHMSGGLSYAAELPHLRLNMVLREMQNVVVSGLGVDSTGPYEEPWVFWQFQSNAASDTLPKPFENPTALAVPPPGETWDIPNNAYVLFQGIIENGCLGSPAATFDVTMNSWIERLNGEPTLGEVQLSDEVQGYGNYHFNYTIQATDEAGNVSDFLISGDVRAMCSGQSSF